MPLSKILAMDGHRGRAGPLNRALVQDLPSSTTLMRHCQTFASDTIVAVPRAVIVIILIRPYPLVRLNSRWFPRLGWVRDLERSERRGRPALSLAEDAAQGRALSGSPTSALMSLCVLARLLPNLGEDALAKTAYTWLDAHRDKREERCRDIRGRAYDGTETRHGGTAFQQF